MACNNITLSGIVNDCSSSMGGIKRVAMFPYSYLSACITETAPDGTAYLSSTAYTYCKPYTFRKNTGSMTSTATIDAANGTNYWSTELSLQFSKMEASKRIEIQSLVSGEVGVLVNDSNNKWWLLGKDEPVTVSAGTGQTGQSKSDGNFYNITLTDESVELPYELEGYVSNLESIFN